MESESLMDKAEALQLFNAAYDKLTEVENNLRNGLLVPEERRARAHVLELVAQCRRKLNDLEVVIRDVK